MIEKNLKNGAYVVIKNKPGDYQVFSPQKDADGDYRRSGWCESIETAKQYIGSCWGYSDNLDDQAKRKNWEVVEIFYGQQPTFKEGDRIKVLENGKIGRVTKAVEGYIKVTGRGFMASKLPTQLAHAESEEVEELTVDQICKELGREIKIKR
jgi:hypothetical protein